MPYYTQLYKSEMKAQDIDFLLNKDLKETFVRELEASGNITGTSASTSTSAGNVSTSL